MKHHLYTILVGLSLLISGSFACTDLEVLAPCSPDTVISIEGCDLPLLCERTFRVENVENLENPRFNWALSRNGVIIENARTPEFTSSLDSAGNYLVTVLISFEFSDCSQPLETSFTLNGDLPIASIGASRMECIVGDCTIKLWQDNENADNWTWSIPGTTNNFANQDTIMVSFNNLPGEYRIGLTATNFNGTVSDEKTITVKPQTFVLRGDQAVMEALDNVLCLAENGDGSISAIGNNEETTYSFGISRAGGFVSGSLKMHNSLPNFYDRPLGRSCKIIEGRHIVVGDVFFNNSNTDLYLASFDSNFSPDRETGFKSSTDGVERAFSLIGGLDQGYILCGNTRRVRGSSSGTEGMVFVKLDESFEREYDAFLFTESPSNTALDIITMGNEYVVSGNVANRGCYFRLNANMEMVANSFIDLGVDFTSPFLVKTGDDSFLLIGKNGNSTILQPVVDFTLGSRKVIGSTNIKQGIVDDGQLILVGYRGTITSRQPLLLVFGGTDLSASSIIDEVFLTTEEVGEFLNVVITADGGFILGGSASNGTSRDFLVIRTNSSGKI